MPTEIHDPATPQDAETMRALGQHIKATIGPQLLFTLLISQNGRAGVANYISNAQRADVIEMLRETADRLEQGSIPATPHAN